MDNPIIKRNDLFFMDDLRELPEEFYTLLPSYVMMVFCNSGKLQLRMDGKEFMVNASQCLICKPGTVLEDLMMSPGLNLGIVGFSWSVVEASPALGKHIWQAYDRIDRNPVISFTESDREVLEAFYRHSLLIASRSGEYFYKETTDHLLRAFIFECLGIIARDSGTGKMHVEDIAVKQESLILRRFLDLLAARGGKVRSVAESAMELNLSPKYFSRAIKSASGRPPMAWIHEYTVKAIEQQLRYSDLSVKEIAGNMGFPSLSSFGKYVRTHLGLSPTAYRNTANKI